MHHLFLNKRDMHFYINNYCGVMITVAWPADQLTASRSTEAHIFHVSTWSVGFRDLSTCKHHEVNITINLSTHRRITGLKRVSFEILALLVSLESFISDN